MVNYIRYSAYIEVCQYFSSTLSGRGVLAIRTVPMATLLTSKETGGVLDSHAPSLPIYFSTEGALLLVVVLSPEYLSCSPLQVLSAFGS